jgi:hypothetical protein
MNRLFDLVKSDLFWSIAGGFALGLAGISVIKPASAGSGEELAKSVTVEIPDYAPNSQSTQNNSRP